MVANSAGVSMPFIGTGVRLGLLVLAAGLALVEVVIWSCPRFAAGDLPAEPKLQGQGVSEHGSARGIAAPGAAPDRVNERGIAGFGRERRGKAGESRLRPG